jgi:phenylpropionate dioxygenase-like ring-hydroxylating dioxygenase large terminal subunit
MEHLGEIVDWKNGLISPAIHFDEEVYKVERERIFNRVWLVVGHETMAPTPGSYVTNYMGEVPVILTRDTVGDLHVLVNKCTHRGNQVCLFDRGKARGFVCSYHGWSYGLDGSLNGIPIEDLVFPDGVDKSQLGLQRVPRVERFHGLVFASFDPDAPALKDWLGDGLSWFLENFVLSVPFGGLELKPGWHRCHSPGNWKLASENFIGDNYHVFSASHVAWLAVCQEFGERGIYTPGTTFPQGMGGATPYEVSTGLNGSAPFGAGLAQIDDIAYKQDYEEAQQLGPEVVEWVEHRYRVLQEVSKDFDTKVYSFMNGMLFPNLGIQGFISPFTGRQFLMFHPRGARSHECWQWTMVEREAPQVVKDLATARAYQTQAMGGLIAPDDVENFERMVDGTSAENTWERPFYMQIQSGHEIDGPKDLPVRLGPNPSEANQRNFYRFWLEMMERS